MPLYDIIIYIIIFVVCSPIPIYLSIKFNSILLTIGCIFMSAILAIFMINLLILSGPPRFYTVHDLFRWNEFYEVFWLVPPFFVTVICSVYFYKRRDVK